MNVGAFAEGADLLAASNFEDSTVSQQVGDVGLCEDYVTIAEAYLAENGTVVLSPPSPVFLPVFYAVSVP